MSIFSDTNHTPSRIHAIMKLLDAIEAPAGRSTLEAYLLPHLDADTRDRATSVDNSLKVGRDLGLIFQDAAGYRSVEPAPEGFGPFSDLCYDRLLAAEAPNDNAILFDAIACVAARTEESGATHWFVEANSTMLASIVEPVLKRARTTATTFNDSRVPTFKRWLTALGLAVPIGNERLYPDVTERLQREVAREPSFRNGATLRAREFLSWAKERLPFLPGGGRARALGLPVGGEHAADVLLSQALRNFHDEGQAILELQGDSSSAVSLRGSLPHRLQSFTQIVIPAQVAE